MFRRPWLEHEDTFDVEQSQTRLTCLDSFDHLCITIINIWLSVPNFRREWHFKNSDSQQLFT